MENSLGRRDALSAVVLLIDDHDLFREGLKAALREAGCFDVFHDVRSLEEGVAFLARRETGVQLVILDLMLEDTSGEGAVERIKEAAPDARILVVSMTDDSATIFDCLAAGAHGYVPKRLAGAEAMHAVRQVLDGRVYVPPNVHKRDGRLPTQKLYGELQRLSARLQDVARELATGATTKMIAYRLGLSEGTVKLHLSSIYRALGCHNRAQAVALINQLGRNVPWFSDRPARSDGDLQATAWTPAKQSGSAG